MDLASRGYIEQEYQSDWVDAPGGCSFHGRTFLWMIVPFLEWEVTDNKPFKTYVDPRYVLGACIGGKPHNVAELDVPRRLLKYSTEFDTGNPAQYTWHKPLGILTAHEGKHRVAFMRQHGDVPIAAWVREQAYPGAERIELISPTFSSGEWYALLDRRYVQLLRRPMTSKAFLEAYGVKVVSWRQLEGLVTEELVRELAYEHSLHRSQDFFREVDRTIDLSELAAGDPPAEETLHQRLDGLARDGYQFNWLKYLRWPGGMFVGALVLGLFSAPQAKEASMLLWGAAVALACAPMVMEWRRGLLGFRARPPSHRE